jgi:hypothetical protein
MLCRADGLQTARSSAPAKAAEVLHLLQGHARRQDLESLRSKLRFLPWERFEASSCRRQHDFDYSPRARALEWGGPNHISPSQVCFLSVRHISGLCTSSAFLSRRSIAELGLAPQIVCAPLLSGHSAPSASIPLWDCSQRMHTVTSAILRRSSSVEAVLRDRHGWPLPSGS